MQMLMMSGKSKKEKESFDKYLKLAKQQYPEVFKPEYNAMINEGIVEYSYWIIWCRTFEGNRRWHMGRFHIDTDAESAYNIVRSCLSGGVGGDAAEVLEVECGYNDDLWRDYTDIELR